MDQNITGMIAANVTLIQPWYAGAIALIGAALFGAVAAGLFTIYRDGLNNKTELKNNQIRAVNNLRGRKHTMLQSKASYYSALSEHMNQSTYAKIIVTRYIDYDKIRSQRISEGTQDMEKAQQYVNEKVDSSLRKSLELKESLRQKIRYEKLQGETAKNDERFWETIGLIKTLFPNNKVDELISAIKDADKELGKLEEEYQEELEPIREKIRTHPGLIKSNPERDEWVSDMMKNLDNVKNIMYPNLRSKIDNFDSKIDYLLNYLEYVLIDRGYFKGCRLFCSDKICPLSPDYIPWILTNNGGQMKLNKLRRCAALADIDTILERLAREGKIRITGEIISIIDDHQT